MEVNLDDKYYQKYIEYKQKYLLLKQLKNNDDDLEGGMFGFFGSKKETDITSSNYGDGDYLVFNIDKINIEDYVYLVDINSTKSIGIGTFRQKYKDKSYIINKKGTKITGNIITTRESKSNINKSLLDMRKQLFLNEVLEESTLNTKNPKLTDIISKYTTYFNDVNNVLSTTGLPENITSRLEEYRSTFQTQTENVKKNIYNTHADLQNLFNEFSKMPDIKKYDPIGFSFSLAFTKTNVKEFFTAMKKETDVDLNMIIKIKPVKKSDTVYNFDARNAESISFTQKYYEIDKHRVNAKSPDQLTTVVTTTEVTTTEETPQ